MREILTAAGIVAGVFFMFVASFGLVRLPDFYIRVHAPTKAATLGLFALVGATLLAVPAVPEGYAVMAALFIGATIPLSGHVLLRAAYRAGVMPAANRIDEYRVYLDRERAGARPDE